MSKRKQTVLQVVKKVTKEIVDEVEFRNERIRILSWNVNGIRAWVNKSGTLGYVTRPEVDIVCFNETKLQDKHVESLSSHFPQFRYQYWTCSKTKLGYSGVAVLTKVKPLNVHYGLPGHPDEGRLVMLEFKDFFLVATYVPNSMSRFEYRIGKWDSDLKDFLNKLKQDKHVVWIGDFNVINLDIDVYRLEGNEECAGGTKEERANFKMLIDDGFCDSFREIHPDDRKYSWFNVKRKTAKERNEGWRFDMAVVDNGFRDRIIDSLVHDNILGSDHYPIELILSNPNRIPST